MNKFFGTVILVALVVIGMATSPMAFQVTTTQEQMILNSTCDRAGTVTMTFESADWEILQQYITPSQPAVIKVLLRGEEVAGAPYPTMCKTIPETQLQTASGLQDISNYWKFAPGTISPKNPQGLDANVTVQYTQGDDFIIVRIYSLSPEPVQWGAGSDPFFKFGLQSVGDAITDDTPICTKVTDYTLNSRLIILNNPTPQNLQFTGDRVIATFSGTNLAVANCPKAGKGSPDECALAVKTTVPLCPIQNQACPTYTECAIINGDWPNANENYTIEIASNPTVDKIPQAGIFLSSVVLTDYNTGAVIPASVTYYDAAGNVVTPANCGFRAVTFKANVSGTDLASKKKVRACIKFEIDPDAAVLNSSIYFRFFASSLPCGDLLNQIFNTGIKIGPCAGGCLYFQYVLQQQPPWFTGIAITKLEDTPVLANSILTMTLTDSDGNQFQWVKEGLDTVIYAFGLDTVLTNFKPLVAGTTIKAGPAWLKVQANFKADGYEYITNGSYAASVLARFCSETGIEQ